VGDIVLGSTTFWRETVPLLGAFASCLVALVLLLRVRLRRHTRRHSLRALVADRAGTATAVDFVLTLPIFVFLMFALLQFALLINGSLVVHYAAYHAARAAKAHAVNMENAYWELDCCHIDTVSGLGALYMAKLLAFPDEKVQRKVFSAAAFNLVALAPSSKRVATDRESSIALSANGIDKFFSILTDDDVQQTDYLLHKANYAFDDRYTKVHFTNPVSALLEGFEKGDVSASELLQKLAAAETIADSVQSLASSQNSDRVRTLSSLTSVPVTAVVSFRFPLLVFAPARLFHQSDDDIPGNDLGRWLTAEVTLL
jgi:hypothetical protein